MARWLVIVTVALAGVTPPAHAASTAGRGAASAKATERPTKGAATRKRAKPGKHGRGKRVRAAKRERGERKHAGREHGKRRGRAVPRVPDRTTNYALNMPRGFAWPPSREMRAASASCERDLDRLGITWERGRRAGRIVDPIVIPAMQLAGIAYTSVYRRGPHALDCQFARTLATIGPLLHELGVREVRFGSIFRNTTVQVGGKRKNILSRHTLGLAMDVVEFVDHTGRVANVARDYLGGDPLLLAIEEAINRTGKFRIVLTPRNDPISHDDHFHIEAAVDYRDEERGGANAP
jgi:hypothetical protein